MIVCPKLGAWTAKGGPLFFYPSNVQNIQAIVKTIGFIN